MNYYFLENPFTITSSKLLTLCILLTILLLIIFYFISKYLDEYLSLGIALISPIFISTIVFFMIDLESVNDKAYYISHDKVKEIHNTLLYDQSIDKINNTKILSTKKKESFSYTLKLKDDNNINIQVNYHMNDNINKEKLNNIRLDIFNKGNENESIHTKLEPFIKNELEKRLYSVDLNNYNQFNNELDDFKKYLNKNYGLIIEVKEINEI